MEGKKVKNEMREVEDIIWSNAMQFGAMFRNIWLERNSQARGQQ